MKSVALASVLLLSAASHADEFDPQVLQRGTTITFFDGKSVTLEESHFLLTRQAVEQIAVSLESNAQAANDLGECLRQLDNAKAEQQSSGTGWYVALGIGMVGAFVAGMAL